MEVDNTNRDHELRLKLYAEARSDLLKRQLSNSENADRAILSVSTAALGFSLAFLKDITPLHGAVFGFLPYLSWAFFVLSILITLFSFFTSQKAIYEQLDLAHKYYIERDDAAAQVRPKYAKITDVLNRSGAASLVLGLFVTCVFVGVNLSRGKNMAENKQINEGATVPSIQRVPQSGGLEHKGAPIPALQTIPTNPQSGAQVPSLQRVPSPPNPASTENSKSK